MNRMTRRAAQARIRNYSRSGVWTRFEYVPGSSRADRSVTFTTQENEAGSKVLRWQVNGPLLPGQSGMVSFQVRIR